MASATGTARVLSIAGSDPTGGAGLQLDLQVFRALGVHGCAVPTGLTVQDTAKVHRVLPLFPNVMTEQLRAGDDAMERLSFEEQARHYRCATDLLERTGGGQAARLEVMLRLGRAQVRTV